MTRIWDRFLTEADRRILEVSGYGRSQSMGARPALLVIDVTYAFIGDERMSILESAQTWRNSCGENGWAALPATQSVLTAARAKRLPVFFTTGTAPRPDRFDRGAWDFKNRRAAADTSPEVAKLANVIPPEIAPLPSEFQITKYKPSAFFGTALSAFLVDLKIDTLIVCGTTTSGCVRASVLDAFNLNYHIAVVEEATFDRFESSHALSLFDINAKYADVLPLTSVLAYLDTIEAGLFDSQISFTQ
jgi:maleamate amidohydrolase